MDQNNKKNRSKNVKSDLLMIVVFLYKTIIYFLIKLFNILYKILLTIVWPIKKFSKTIILKIYHIFFKIKNQKLRPEQKQLFNKNKEQVNNINIFSYILLFIFGIFVITNNLFGKVPEADELSNKSLISKIISSENDYYSTSQETIIDEAQPQITNFHINNQNGYLEAPQPQAINNSSKIASNLIPMTDLNSALLGTQFSESSLKDMPRDEIINYEVQPGDTISSIAQQFNISIQTILWSNNLTYYSMIKPGMSLKILPTTGLLHKIVRGDNLSAIAKKYQADTDKILLYNKLNSPEEIAIGQDLIIPDGIKPATKVVYSQPSQTNRYSNVPSQANVVNTGTKLLWPTSAKRISQYYSWRHSGLDIAGPVGTPIYAAESGTVETAGWNRGGYGYYIIINHGNGMKTLYGHASKLYVVSGQKVSRGQTIMAMGSTGRSTGPHLHFEVRIGGFRNPLSYIR